ncbi:MAG TPA: mechanosensitive ion channel domain-containing protein [Verrucomicrobiae bacterium]|jgi:small-conductance mechanosensitive channel
MNTDHLSRIADASNKIWEMMFDPKTALGAAFYGLIALLAAWLAGRAVRVAIHRVLDRAQRAGSDATGIRFLGKLASLLIYVAAFVCYAHVIPELQSLGKSMLAGVGIASVVVGLAAQSTLGNLIAGVSLVLYRPFKIGDHVQVSAPGGLEAGVVVNIDLGYTVLRTANHRMLVIPNSSIASQASYNLSSAPSASTLAPPRVPCGISVYVAAGSDVAKARQMLIDAAKAHPKIAGVDGCYLTRVTSRGALLTLAATTADANAAPAVKSDLLEHAMTDFGAAGVKMV